MKSTIALIALMIMAVSSRNIEQTYRDGGYFSSKAYLRKTANEKMVELWNAINEDHSVHGFYSALKVAKILLECLEPTFEHLGDDFPEGREKLIHTKGVISKCDFKIYDNDNNKYTGFLKEGSTNCLIRLSAASAYKTDNGSPDGAHDNFVPGMAIKILVDGEPSVNFVAMHSTSGQRSWNFFEHPFTNSFQIDPDSSLQKVLLARRFRKITSWISSVGISEFAIYKESGKINGRPNYPFRLELIPTSEVKDLSKKYYTEDFVTILKRIPVGTTIWKLAAYDKPDCEPTIFGEVINTTEFVTSLFSDIKLFFRHQLVDEDDKENKRIYDASSFRDSYGFFGLYEGTAQTTERKCPLGY